ncbi:ABC transporter permease [Mesoplasma seiffertii]|uniref:ABC transporter permease n=1 Tax=Mesoplasma seiffertii TaxID=28224 RepID=UPI00047BD978|nr:ABC transporter permease [Mesoplasma seiffertii]
MKLKLLLKQSLNDFWSKKVLYLSFTLFLSIALSLVLGLFSFITYFSGISNKILGDHNHNIHLQNKFRVAKQGTKLEKTANLWIDEENQVRDYVFNILDEAKFFENSQLKGDYQTTESQKALAADFVDLEGVTPSWTYIYQDQEILDRYQDLTLSRISDLRLLSRNFLVNSSRISNNLITKFFYHRYNDQFNRTGFSDSYGTLNYDITTKPIAKASALGVKVTANHREWFADETAYEQAQKHFQLNSMNDIYIESEIDFNSLDEAQKLALDEGRFVYMSPKYFKEQGYKVGEFIKLRTNTNKTTSFLIAGTAMDRFSIVKKSDQAAANLEGYLYMSAQGYERNYPTLSYGWNQMFFYDADNNIGNHAQIIIESDINHIFKNSLNSKIVLSFNDQYKDWSSPFVTRQALTIMSLMCYSVGGLVVLLTILVFFFITDQFIKMQRQTLFFLKSLGERKIKLALLTTFAVLIPLILALAVSLLGAILVNAFMTNAVASSYLIAFPKLSLNLAMLLGTSALILILLLAFFAINLWIINGKTLTLAGMNLVKTPAPIVMKIKSNLPLISSKARIGLSFAIKNVYKNMVTFVILTLSFTVILFSIQFNQSVDYASKIGVIHNAPYKSVKYSTEEEIFYSPNYNETYGLNYSTEVIHDLTDLHSIDSIDEFIQISLASIVNADITNPLTTDISKYYLSAQAINQVVNLNEEKLDKKIISIIANYPKLAKLYESKRSTIMDSFKIFKEQVDKIVESLKLTGSKQLDLNILFGKNYVPLDSRSYWTNGASLTGEKQDWIIGQGASRKRQDSYQFALPEVSKKPSSISILDMSEELHLTQENKKMGKTLDVEVSLRLAKEFNYRVGNYINFSMDGIYDDLGQPISIPARIVNIQKTEVAKPIVYFDKDDYLLMVKEVLIRQLQDQQREAVLALARVTDLIEKSKVDSTGTFLNNTVFSKTNLPWNIQYITLPKINNLQLRNDLKIEESSDYKNFGRSVVNYYDKETLTQYFGSFAKNTIVYPIMQQRIKESAQEYTKIMERFSYIAIAITISISIIVVMLILLENRQIILLFKAMGYRSKEVNTYLVGGYILSGILALSVSFVISTSLIGIASPIIQQAISVTLVFVWSTQLVVTGIIMLMFFVILVISSIIGYTKKQHPKDAFSTL